MTAQQFYDERIKDLADGARLVEAHPPVWASLLDPLKQKICRPL
jgi:hypothetical protein